jgi:hypothetical protein
MAITLEDGAKVWRKVDQALANANPCIQGQFDALKAYIVNQKGNPTLQFIAFNDADLIQSTGVSPIAVPCTLYGVYFIKNGTFGTGGTGTDSWLTIGNAATNTVDATKFVALMTSVANQQVAAIYPNGLIFGTDITLTGETSAQDGTESTAGDSGSCFIVIGSL